MHFTLVRSSLEEPDPLHKILEDNQEQTRESSVEPSPGLLGQQACAGLSAPQLTDLLFSVVEQVVLEGIWEGKAQDLLTEEVHRGVWLGLRWGFLLLPPLLFQVFAAVVVGGVGDPAGKDLFVQKDDGLHAAAAHSPPLEPGRVLQSVSVFDHRFLVDDFFNGAPDGDAGQVLEASNCQGW